MAALRYPWEAEPVPVAPSPLADPEEQPRKRRGRRAAARIHPASPVAPTPQWLYHHLTISGPAETVAAFAVAARGSGVVPWQLDFNCFLDLGGDLTLKQWIRDLSSERRSAPAKPNSKRARFGAGHRLRRRRQAV